MKDLVIGAITGYNFDAIRPWVNSLDRSGFAGDKAMICYNVSFETVDELSKRGYKVFGFERNEEERRLEYTKPGFNIVCERFHHLWSILQNFKSQYRYVITTDVKDVVFQRNPSEWLENNLGVKKVNASSESMYYKEEEHSNFALYSNYGPAIYGTFCDKLIYNAGVMSGDFDTMVDLFMQIYLLCDAAPSHWNQHGGGPDQPAYNILAHSKPLSDIIRYTPSEDGWAAQLGTTGPYSGGLGRYGSKIVEPAPIMIDGKVCTTEGAPFYIVHQYDRIPEWKSIILEQY
jgi:hypothetical protein